MKLELRSKGVPMTEGLRAFIERKLRFAMGRFAHRIQRVRVRLTDVNGPRGGEDIECHIRAHLGAAGSFSIHELERDTFAAVSRASERAHQQLARQLERKRKDHRQHLPVPSIE